MVRPAGRGRGAWSFTPAERDAIERAREEVDQVRRTVLASEARGEARGKALGEAHGEARGTLKGLREALLAVVGARGWTLTAAQAARVAARADAAALAAWCAQAATAASPRDVLGH